VAHVHSVGSACVHSAHGPRLAGPASACAARDCATRHVSAHQSGHRAPGACHGAAGGGATVAEVEQRKAFEHPRQRGHPPGMLVEAIAHRSFLSTGRVKKLGQRQRSPMRWGAPVTGGSCVGAERERKLGSTIHREKAARGGARGSAHRGGVRDDGGGRTAVVVRSDNDVVSFGHGRRRGRDGRT
jgi:hypothetical protein